MHSQSFFCVLFSVAPTTITLDPLQLTVTEPDSATFTCNATARPRPTVTWYTDNDSGNTTLLVDGSNDVKIMEQETGDRELTSTLTISPIAPSDATDYVCVAENVVDTDEMTNNLTVYGMYILIYLSICNVCTCGMITPMNIIIFCMLLHTVTPTVTRVYPDVGQMNYTVNETDTVTFECSATGIPPPTITWLRNGMELNNVTDSRVTVGDPMETDFERGDGETVSMVTRTLNLINTTDDDSGMYTCMAANDANPGEDTVDFELIVQSKLILMVTIPDMHTCSLIKLLHAFNC